MQERREHVGGCESCEVASDSEACAACWRERPWEPATPNMLSTWAEVLPGRVYGDPSDVLG